MELIWKILDSYIWGPGFFIAVCLAVHFAMKASELAQENQKLKWVLKHLENKHKAGGMN